MTTTMKKITKVLIPRIVAIILLIGIGIGQVINCGTMICTAIKLNSISNNIVYIETLAETTPSGWSTEKEEEYKEYIDKRDSLINSSDSTVAKFASANDLQRFGQFLLPLFASILLLYSASMLSISTFKYFIFKILEK